MIENEEIEEIKKSGLFDNAIKYIAKLLQKSKATGKQRYADTLVFNEFGELLLLQRSSADDFEPSKWSLPGGKIEEGERSDAAAPRELQEETGINSSVTFVNEWQDETCHIYYYMAQVPKSTIILLDTEEHYKYDWVDLSELKEYDLLMNLGERLTDLVGADMQGGKVTSNPFQFTDVTPIDSGSQLPLQKSEIEMVNEAFETISKGFDDGLVNEEKFFSAKRQRDYLLSLYSIKKALDEGEDVEELFLKALTEDFVSDEYLLKAETTVPLTASISPGSDKIDKKGNHVGTGKHVDELAEYARKTPLEKLMQFIKQSDDAELRKIAHQEVARREKEEKPQDDEKAESKPAKPAADKKPAAKPKPKAKPASKPKPEAEESNPVLAADDSGNTNVEAVDKESKVESKPKKDESSKEDKPKEDKKEGKFKEDEIKEVNAYFDASDPSKNPFLEDFHAAVDAFGKDKAFDKEIDAVTDGADAENAEELEEEGKEDESKPDKE